MAKKLTPYEAFQVNMQDAEALLSYARAFRNKRTRGMREELRTRVGQALKVPVGRRDELDCLESDDVFVVFKPNGKLGRDEFADLQPLLRQALVAGCAALETYVADKVMEHAGAALEAEEVPARMRDISLTIGHWIEIERVYKRRRWGIRPIVNEYVEQTSSTAPSSIGILMSTIGVTEWASKVDRARNVERTTTVKQLDEITKRRNRIAHVADRQGRGRATARAAEVDRQLNTIGEVVEALERVLSSHRV